MEEDTRQIEIRPSRQVEKSTKTFRGSVTAKCGELIQGPIVDERGRLLIGLVTQFMPCYRFEAEFKPDFSSDRILIFPPDKPKSERLTEVLRSKFPFTPGGQVTLNNPYRDIPFIPDAGVGLGLGTSTGDACALERAVLKSVDFQMSPDNETLLLVEAEGASDAIAFENEPIVILCSRVGRVWSREDHYLPKMIAVSFLADTEKVPTTAITPQYSAVDVADFSRTVGLFREGLQNSDSEQIGRACTMSAEINNQYLPKKDWTTIKLLREKHNAVGISVAHTGQAVSLLFDATQGLPAQEAEDELRQRGFLMLASYRFGGSPVE